MSVLVSPKNEQEEKVLLAFLNSLHYNYQSDIGDNENTINAAFIEQYNQEIDEADAEIADGSYIKHQDVEVLLKNRRKAL